MQHYHFIAIGGAAMHNLALALHDEGYKITGSDDEINDPSKSRLQAKGLLPESIGWFPQKITTKIDGVILGMHARKDNPELLKAQELGLKIFSYPEFVYEATKNKIRIVIGGSHGKTSITSMILHVFAENNIATDFLVGAQLKGFTNMVKFSESSKFAVIEGDEYLTSPIDLRPKFHLYHPNIALISGIAWDHINVFPTWENYVEQFKIFIDCIENDGSLVYYKDDTTLNEIASKSLNKNKYAYKVHPYEIEDNITFLITPLGKLPVKVFGEHNLANISGAKQICMLCGINEVDFYSAIATFEGAAKRLQKIKENYNSVFYFDFAHSPSKLKATTKAVKEQFKERKLIACMELHTFSSLKKEFLEQYHGAMDEADIPYVYFNPHTIEHKKLEAINPQEVKDSFKNEKVKVFTNSKEMVESLKKQKGKETVFLMMTSGNFDGIKMEELADLLLD
jgi:UDP-N-acetylmuramate: L-alanyl-gamma-D-glutamyl-meso-diaminopimelate ligase